MEWAVGVREEQLRAWTGQWVCAVMADGSYAIGQVRRVKKGTLWLKGMAGEIRLSPIPDKARAQIAGMGLGSLFGSMSSGGRGLGTLGRGIGMASRLFGGGSWIKLGLNALSFLMPLMTSFFF